MANVMVTVALFAGLCIAAVHASENSCLAEDGSCSNDGLGEGSVETDDLSLLQRPFIVQEQSLGVENTVSFASTKVDSDRSAWVFKGCYRNEGTHRISGHTSHQTIGGCKHIALRAVHNRFGMEYPQGYHGNEYAWCLTFDGTPSMVLGVESECAAKRDDAGYLLGSRHRLAVYGPSSCQEWTELPGKWLATPIDYMKQIGCQSHSSNSHNSRCGCFEEEEAKLLCLANPDCNGIGKQHNMCGHVFLTAKWTLRQGRHAGIARHYGPHNLVSKRVDRSCHDACSVGNGFALSTSYPCRCGQASCTSGRYCNSASDSCNWLPIHETGRRSVTWFLPRGWSRVHDKHCDNNRLTTACYDNLPTAIAACKDNSQCSGIYDRKCDGLGTGIFSSNKCGGSGFFYMCARHSRHGWEESSGGCIYGHPDLQLGQEGQVINQSIAMMPSNVAQQKPQVDEDLQK